MESRDSATFTGSNNIELAKRCLALISDIAGRGACSQKGRRATGLALTGHDLTGLLARGHRGDI